MIWVPLTTFIDNEDFVNNFLYGRILYIQLSKDFELPRFYIQRNFNIKHLYKYLIEFCNICSKIIMSQKRKILL